jgi:hypothetical protein
MISPAFKNINLRLPAALQIATGKVTGHTGRQTFTSQCLLSGSNVQDIMLATKHKSSAIKRYLHPDHATILGPVLKVARSRIVQDEEEEEEF